MTGSSSPAGSPAGVVPPPRDKVGKRAGGKNDGDGDGGSDAALIGGVIFGVLVLLLLVAVCSFCAARLLQSRQEQRSMVIEQV